MLMKASITTWLGQSAVIMCDGKCSKAWGEGQRPKIILSDNPGDNLFFADDELGTAPILPSVGKGTGKPVDLSEFPTKWCELWCERKVVKPEDEQIDLLNDLPDWSKRRYAMPWMHVEETN
jgi:hypothetical protein